MIEIHSFSFGVEVERVEEVGRVKRRGEAFSKQRGLDEWFFRVWDAIEIKSIILAVKFRGC